MPTKNHVVESTGELRPEYDLRSLTGRVRGKYYARATAGVTLVLLESDVAAAFPNGRAVNAALRSVLAAKPAGRAKLHNKAVQPTSRARRKAKSRKPSRAARG